VNGELVREQIAHTLAYHYQVEEEMQALSQVFAD
jgi:hypothetical protein